MGKFLNLLSNIQCNDWVASGKRSQNRYMHFGKKSSNRFMHFGKRPFEEEVPESYAEKRGNRYAPCRTCSIYYTNVDKLLACI